SRQKSYAMKQQPFSIKYEKFGLVDRASSKGGRMRIANLMATFVLGIPLLACPAPARAGGAPSVGIAVSVRIAPPVLPVYTQPVCPGLGYLWQPGYWAYGDYGYYWVPGIWVQPPGAGLLWTPGYWGFAGGIYAWQAGYWGSTVGFYGGVDYGFGYTGAGFYGGYWRGGQFFYNTRVTNVNSRVIHNVYTRNVANEHASNRVSYNGGPHGLTARATSEQLAAGRGAHTHMTSAQLQNERAAGNDRNMRASVNHGRPDVAASRREELNERSSAPHNAPTTHNAPATKERPAPSSHEARPESKSGASSEPSHPARTPERPSAPEHSAKPAPSHPNNESAHNAAAPAKRATPPANHTKTEEHTKPAPRATEPHTATAPKATQPKTESRTAHAQNSAPSHARKPAAHEQPKAQAHAEAKKPAESKKPGSADR
ncbi:MAG TPA: hypothetical protein VIX91_28060, partial [Candidatus Acidoferrum sp.]